MPTPVIEPGHLVIVEFTTPNGAARASVIVEAVQDGAVLVGKLDGYEIPRLAEGSEANLIVLDRNDMYSLGCTVSRSGDESMRLEVESEAERVVRRQYVRVAVDVPVSCLMLNALKNSWTPFDAAVTDISAGGMAMTADVIVPAGSTVVISIAIPEDTPVVAIGRTLPTDNDTRKVVNLATKGPLVRLEYTSIREAERERLMRFIFSEMLKQRRSEIEERESRTDS